MDALKNALKNQSISQSGNQSRNKSNNKSRNKSRNKSGNSQNSNKKLSSKYGSKYGSIYCRMKDLNIWLLVIALVLSLTGVQTPEKAYGESSYSKVIQNACEDTFDALKKGNKYLLDDQTKASAGSSGSDWTAFLAAKYGLEDDEKGYLESLENSVERKYRENPEKLSRNRATEWHRTALTVLACGGDPTCFGTDTEGKNINLVKDGTYECAVGRPWRQGINGAAYALLILDSENYQIPENAAFTREDIVSYILSREIKNGGFALTGNLPDPDVTAMVLQALAPYKENPDVKETVSRGVNVLSHMQDESGAYKSYGTLNAESTSQVIIAVTSLGIDPFTDKRFISSEGKTLFDGLMQFHLSSGGFSHTNDGILNGMACQQAALALTALLRSISGKPPLFVMEDRKSAPTLRPLSTERPEETDSPEKTPLPEVTGTPENSETPEESKAPVPENSKAPEESKAPAPENSDAPESSKTSAAMNTEAPKSPKAQAAGNTGAPEDKAATESTGSPGKKRNSEKNKNPGDSKRTESSLENPETGTSPETEITSGTKSPSVTEKPEETEASSETKNPSETENPAKVKDSDASGTNGKSGSEGNIYLRRKPEPGYIRIGDYLVSYILVAGAAGVLILAAALILTVTGVRKKNKLKDPDKENKKEN